MFASDESYRIPRGERGAKKGPPERAFR